MNKKAIKSILFAALLVFIVSFGITILSSKPSEDKNKTITANTKEVSLLNEFKKEKDIKISNEVLENIGVEIDFLSDFMYYLDKSKKTDKPSDFKEIFKGKGKNVEFSTDFKIIKIKNQNKEEYYKLPLEYEKDIEKLFNKEIYISFDAVKQYKTWNSVTIDYKDNSKEISKIKLEDFNNKIIRKKALSEYQAARLGEYDENFNITIKGNGYELNLQTIGSSAMGVYYKEYKAYYEIDEQLYNYLCDIFYISKEDRIVSNEKKISEFDWVEKIEINDIVNKMDGEAENSDKDELLNSLFRDNMEKVKFDTYEVKRYSLKLIGNGKTEKITVYENHIQRNGDYYKIKNVDLIIDSFMNEF